MLIAHRKELIEQAQAHAQRMGLTAGIEMAEQRAWREQVVCAMVQTLTTKKKCKVCEGKGCDDCDSRGWRYRVEKFRPDEFGSVIIDEGHHAAANTYRRVMKHFQQNKECKILLVTATPHRGDGIGLYNVADVCAYEMSIGDAIGDGYLVPIRQQFVTVSGLDLEQVGSKPGGGDFKDGELERAMLGNSEDAEEQARMAHSVIAPLIDIAGPKPTLIFASGCEHAQRLTDAANSYDGVRAELVLGSTKPYERAAILRRYQSGETNYLVNVGVATEGFDAPHTAVVALARPTKSLGLYMQMIGRGTRPLPGVVDGPETAELRRAAIADSAKRECLIVDFCGSSGAHKLVSMVDVLAGEEAPELKSEMVDLAKKNGKALSLEEMQALLEKAREERAAKEREEAAKAEQRGDGYKSVRCDYTTDSVDMFGGSKSDRMEVVYQQGHGTLSEKQFKLLCKLGVKPEMAADYTKRQAHAVIGNMSKGTGADYRLTFGKHAGKTLKEVPNGYLRWLVQENIGRAAEHARVMIDGPAKTHAPEPAPF